MTDTLLTSLGLYGGTFALALISGLVPIVAIELFLIGIAGWGSLSVPALALLILLAAVGHQVAKTLCFYASIGAVELPGAKVKQRIEAVRARVARWNNRPRLVLLLSATVGFPPMYVIGFVASPLMSISIVPFTTICFLGRTSRYAVLVAIPMVM